MQLPARIEVSKYVSGRYAQPGYRPDDWDQRIEGVDVVQTTGGETIKLQSDGMQSAPDKGWVLMLTDGSESAGYHWTLYGYAREVRH